MEEYKKEQKFARNSSSLRQSAQKMFKGEENRDRTFA